MGLFDKIFGTYSDRQLKKIEPLVDKIESMAERYRSMSDETLRNQTAILKERLANGETLDDILPEAFATVREADDRVLGKRPFRVQLIGGIVLHQGRIAEMKTGEGKTLVATLPAYLNALEGKGVHIVTVNEYLARMGFEEMGRVYDFLGLTTGLIIHDQTSAEKKAAYACDITYSTNNELGFDYLRDNMAISKQSVTQRNFNYAIVDEVDSILIDEARTPLIISGQGEASTDLYQKADALVSRMKAHVIKKLDSKEETDDIEGDYVVDEKARSTILTAEGIKKCEKYFGLENLSDPENATIAHHINQAIRAHGIMKRDANYIVKDGQVMIVDEFTGRIMPGRRYSDGLHQAIEAKEGVEIEKETKTLATITFQNFFRMYPRLSGMTGTALTEEEEFKEIYSLDVIVIPTNKPMIRKDHHDLVYSTVKGKYAAIIRQIEECHKKGQPVLVGTVSVEKSEILSKLLKMRGIEHTVLNAKHHEKEAEIVAMAGKFGKVTIATNMAGRGTDIMLGGNPEFLAKQEMKKMGYEEEIIGLAVGSSVSVSEEVFAARDVYRELFDKYKEEIRPEAEEVCRAGGLFIIGTERHESRRIDNQLRGRSGRQGDPGESRFYIAMEDDLMRLFGSDKMLAIVQRLGLPEDEAIDAKILSDSIENAQKRLESENFSRRRNVLNYDDVMNQQRNIIYKERKAVLDGADLTDKINGMISDCISQAMGQYLTGSPEEWDFDGLRNHFFGLLFKENDLKYSEDELKSLTVADVESIATERAAELYASKSDIFGEEQFKEIERIILLRNVDLKWMDHLDAMDSLRGSVGLNAYAQRNPLTEYRIVGGDMFDAMVSSIREDTVRGILSATPREKLERKAVAKVTGISGGSAEASKANNKPTAKGPGVKKQIKVGPNEPCPCGSGKKYKKCCALKSESDQQ